MSTNLSKTWPLESLRCLKLRTARLWPASFPSAARLLIFRFSLVDFRLGYGGQPFVQKNGALFKDGADFYRELFLAFAAAIDAPFRHVGRILRTAVLALGFSIGPAEVSHELNVRLRGP